MRFSIYLLCSLLSFLFSTNLQGQFKRKDLESTKDISIYRGYVNAPTNAFDATKSLPAKYVSNGTVDYTSAIQSALDKHNVVLLPNFPILTTGLKVRSNQKLYFNSKSKLIMKANNRTHYAILDIVDVRDVSVYNANITGDRIDHLGLKGEWGMGINIVSSQNVSVYNSVISNCWGDGIYIGGGENKPSKNVIIRNAILDFNRRNGLSIVNANTVILERVFSANTQGTKPMCGIDIEPNRSSDLVSDIVIRHCKTMNNFDVGLVINLTKLKKINRDNVHVKVEAFEDEGSKIGIGMGGLKTVEKGDANKGLVTFDDCHFMSKRPFEIWGTVSNSINIKINKPKIPSADLHNFKRRIKSVAPAVSIVGI